MKKTIKQTKTINAGNERDGHPNYGSFVPFSLVLSLLLIGALAAGGDVCERNSIYRNHVTLWAEVVKTAPTSGGRMKITARCFLPPGL